MGSRTIALALLFSLGASGAALAVPACSAITSDMGCSCAVPIVPDQAIAQVTKVGGDVQKTGAGSYTPISGDTPLKVGDGLILGEAGHSLLTAGPECGLELGAFTSVVVRAVEQCACITAVDSSGAAIHPEASGGTSFAPIAAAAGGGAAALLLMQTEEEQDSP
jgi:hypothetical protein